MRNHRFIAVVLIIAFGVVPFVANEYWLQAILIQFLVFSLAAIGLNILTGYAGQVSLGTGAFMAVGAYATFKITTAFPEINILIVFILAGGVAAGVGILFGLPSLRIKGFYLAVATLAAQFFILWLFNKVGWFYNDSPSGTISAPPRDVFGFLVTGPEATPQARYLVVLGFLTVFALIAKNIVQGRIGRSWMAIRDMDIAAEIIGIEPLKTKLLAFAVSSFYCGLAGALFIFAWLGSAETEAFDIFLSFQILFMIIIGGLGSITGSFIGAAFIVLFPIFLTNVPPMIGVTIPTDLSKHIEEIIFGALIVFFLIVEPHGLARLWQMFKAKLRKRSFP
ncbi:MAG: branched-chain amino acid ABC transporter permease [Rhodospirillaceae bacterium]|jgi:branched-chain amino acid transport system permease protein|nr:branched-chain amino acid ABC transporter permease [Rhodospirillales bacterium]MBT3904173.1 branched-chain amino acid ABC transporter permease [Rhodospirillaceae bacterium]MBT4701935.1 branched-chain amino acid ABC transporter permease [Rhodospirillaceae bacterium]MBT5035427.1 branched-chain amino acid ABC transporter permease [Rhodospirillaceae bacterium]MBT6218569.1 branched-chain amino acid ABC transporter permease [Rhodospirillaceae bacterium]